MVGVSVDYATGELIQRSEMSPTLGALAAALCKAQAAFPPVPKTRVGKIKGVTKDGKPYEYSYGYAALDDILLATRPALTENGLAVVQPLNGGSVRTLLLHESGEWLASDTRLPLDGATKAQDVGSAVTYMRRYALCSMLGIAPEDDDDGASAEPSKPKPATKETSVAAAKAAPPDQRRPGTVEPGQMGQISALLAKLEPEAREAEVARIQADYSVSKAEELSKKEASEVISRLKGEEGQG